MLVALCALAPLSVASAGGGKTMIVAIDPGHGGKDQGAVGPGGILEKNVALQLARRLASLVNSQRGMRAVLTRSGDRFLHLQERIDLARRHKADLFVSIHADAFTNPESRGSSVFVLSTRGASSAAAQWLAKRENAADSPGVAGLDIKDEVVRAVVFDMYHDAILADSMALAEQVLAQLGRVSSLHSGMVERAGFVVLKAPDIPSILVEATFISNPTEAARLRNGKQQQQLAQAILRGIRAYLNNQAPAYRVAQTTPAAEQGPVGAMTIRASARSPAPAAPQKTPAASARQARRQQSQPVAVAGSKTKATGLSSRPLPKASAKVASKPQPASSVKPTVAKTRPARPKSTKVASRVQVVKPGETLAAVTK
jgi:N-acetylmuramoyl-L-alanine amidase